MQRPMAVVIVGGTVSAALLTLVVLPVMYRAAMPLLERFRAIEVAPVVPAPGE
jgi:cobalt-zinc-cadmium resistance protein CzcA